VLPLDLVVGHVHRVQEASAMGQDFVEALLNEQEDFLRPTAFCDSESPVVAKAARNILRGAGRTSSTAASTLFHWVRDNVAYGLGLWSEPASDTLRRGFGSCSNKANALVALLRNIGIPAGFHVMEVKGNEYLGALCTPVFAQFMSRSSLHVLATARLDSRWIKLDPSDDVLLSNATQHLCMQTTRVDFDGRTDACLRLDPDHVLSCSARLSSIDDILAKKRRVPEAILKVFNLYLGWIRQHAIFCDEPEESEERYFLWLRREHPELHEQYFALAKAAR
jgi:hypothetical protein